MCCWNDFIWWLWECLWCWLLLIFVIGVVWWCCNIFWINCISYVWMVWFVFWKSNGCCWLVIVWVLMNVLVYCLIVNWFGVIISVWYGCVRRLSLSMLMFVWKILIVVLDVFWMSVWLLFWLVVIGFVSSIICCWLVWLVLVKFGWFVFWVIRFVVRVIVFCICVFCVCWNNCVLFMVMVVLVVFCNSW